MVSTPDIRVCGARELGKDIAPKSDAIFGTSRTLPHGNGFLDGARFSPNPITQSNSNAVRIKRRFGGETWADPARPAHWPTWLIVEQVGSNLVANSADCAGFADSINL